MHEPDDLVRRLHALAEAPVDPTTAAQHLHALRAADASLPAAVPPRRRRWTSVAAVAAGLFMGSAALAGAATGNLPDAAQDTAHEALAKVGINVPPAKGKAAQQRQDDEQSPADANREGGPGKVERFLGDDTEPCTNADGTPFEGNHGQYVAGHEDDDATADVNERQEAAQSRCGKPVQAGGEDGTGKPDDAGRPESPGQSEDHKPADAGKPDDTGKPDGAGKPDDVPRGPKG